MDSEIGIDRALSETLWETTASYCKCRALEECRLKDCLKYIKFNEFNYIQNGQTDSGLPLLTG